LTYHIASIIKPVHIYRYCSLLFKTYSLIDEAKQFMSLLPTV